MSEGHANGIILEILQAGGTLTGGLHPHEMNPRLRHGAVEVEIPARIVDAMEAAGKLRKVWVSGHGRPNYRYEVQR